MMPSGLTYSVINRASLADRYIRVRDSQLASAVAQFLYDEAALLDEWRLDEWLALFHPEAGKYLIPSPEDLSDDPATTLHLVNDSMTALAGRIERLKSKHAHAESPRSRTRRQITNVRVWEGTDDLLSRSVFDVTRVRGGGGGSSCRCVRAPAPAGRQRRQTVVHRPASRVHRPRHRVRRGTGQHPAAFGDIDAQLHELAMDSGSTPEGIGRGHASCQRLDLDVDRRATASRATGEHGPILAEATSLPPQDGIRGHDQERPSPPRPQPGEGDPEHAVGPAESRSSHRALIDGDLMAQR